MTASLDNVATEVEQCRNGHEFTEDNTYTGPSGRRSCRLCIRGQTLRYRERVRSQGCTNSAALYKRRRAEALNASAYTMARIIALFGTPAEDWQELALCRETDPEVFFPEKGGTTGDAKRVCAQCPVRAACLDEALETRQRYGVWGGKSAREREKLLRARRGVAA